MKDIHDTVKPSAITHNRKERTLLIEWDDGHESFYSIDLMREICPCVECRGGHDQMGSAHDPDILTLTPKRSYEVRDLQLVGNYALQFWWDDGHSSGIYTWSYLRRMCGCNVCIAEANTAGQSQVG